MIRPAASTTPPCDEARAIGAAGYPLMDVDPADLPGFVRDVAAGGTAWHPHARALLEDTTGLNQRYPAWVGRVGLEPTTQGL